MNRQPKPDVTTGVGCWKVGLGRYGTVSRNSGQTHTACSCLLRKAPLGLLRSFALSVTGSVIITADGDYPHVFVYLTTQTVISCRNFLIRETTKLSILAEQLMEKIKNLWYTKVLGY